MSRAYCNVCSRPQVSCICHLVTVIENDIDVVILQHPSEEKQAKGTVALLAQSLKNCHVLVGEHFSERQDFLELLANYKEHIALLYPSENAVVVSQQVINKQQSNLDSQKSDHTSDNAYKCVILLDGTWKKAFRLYMMNELLHYIPHMTLPAAIEGRYRIRTTKKQGALSTLEACSHALSILEGDSAKYDSLLTSFDRFNELQLSFAPNKNK